MSDDLGLPIGPVDALKAKLLLHRVDGRGQCERCGGDFAWMPRLPVGEVAIGLRREDAGPLWVLPLTLPAPVEYCDPAETPWPPKIEMVTKRDAHGDTVVVGYRRA